MRRVLIVRLDAIGDYILWRNCLRFIRHSAKYRNAHITILGNPAWRGLAEAFDADCADEWLWAENRAALFRKPVENLLPYKVWHHRVAREQGKLRGRLRARGFDEVLSPCAFRDTLLDELVQGIAPETRIAGMVDEEFVFFKNRTITATLCGERCNVPLRLELPDPPAKTNRILFFTSASHWTRRWPRGNWRRLAQMLPAGYEALKAPMDGTLPDLARLITSCAAVVSNDTMALHMAAALGVPVVGIVNGVSGRGGFWPYPRDAHGGTPCASTICAGPVAIVGAEVRGVAPSTLLASQLTQYRNIAAVTPEMALSALLEVLR